MKKLVILLCIVLVGCVSNATRQAIANAETAKALSFEHSYQALYGMLEVAATACGSDAGCMRSVEEMSQKGGEDLGQTLAQLNRAPDRGTNGWDFAKTLATSAGQNVPWLAAYGMVRDGFKMGEVGLRQLGRQPPSYIDNSRHRTITNTTNTADSNNTDTSTHTENNPTQTVGGSIVGGDQQNWWDSNNNFTLPENCVIVPFTDLNGNVSFTVRGC